MEISEEDTDDEQNGEDKAIKSTTTNERQIFKYALPSSKAISEDTVNSYKWLNRFRTTTSQMFLCHSNVEYVRNERYPAQVYINKYHKLYGNAYEVILRDCKFYITTVFLKSVDVTTLPNEPVTKHFDSYLLAQIINRKLRDGVSLRDHMIESMYNTMMVGILDADNVSVRSRLNNKDSIERSKRMNNLYSWKSENRKVQEEEKNMQMDNAKDDTVLNLFEAVYENKNVPSFVIDKSLCYDDYINEFQHKVCELKKNITTYVDCVTNVRLMIKDLASLLYDNNNINFDKLINILGDESDVSKFMKTTKLYPIGDVILNMKYKYTVNQRYRVNCFKMNNVYVWINSMVYSKTKSFDLENMLNEYKTGKHYIISFKYMYNSLLNKMHAEVVKLVLRYIISRRDFDLLQKDCCIHNKIIFKKIQLN
ncbi:ie-1 [Adoxophyes orana granulovirus]|uniref:Ie-1 n=1 Tax=Adoxophyes orana granulovirus TaxID=170617 RepID=Q7TA09_GVAO|nr:ie-1 [Adoxophyes orana granulovirus]AAP85643.1 ie-1 [Adoxophyes orana granulovirus]AJA91646.1 IE-1 [Adoxophyes orana granulovirus]